MIKTILRSKVGSALAVVTVIASVGAVASVSAAQVQVGTDTALAGYGKDQCKNGGWMNFKDPAGNPLFKNQGQCIAFFVSNGVKGHVNTSLVDVNIENNQQAHSGDAEERSGDVIITGDTSVSIIASPGAQ